MKTTKPLSYAQIQKLIKDEIEAVKKRLKYIKAYQYILERDAQTCDYVIENLKTSLEVLMWTFIHAKIYGEEHKEFNKFKEVIIEIEF